jgi:hypothetical protein
MIARLNLRTGFGKLHGSEKQHSGIWYSLFRR